MTLTREQFREGTEYLTATGMCFYCKAFAEDRDAVYETRTVEIETVSGMFDTLIVDPAAHDDSDEHALVWEHRTGCEYNATQEANPEWFLADALGEQRQVDW